MCTVHVHAQIVIDQTFTVLSKDMFISRSLDFKTTADTPTEGGARAEHATAGASGGRCWGQQSGLSPSTDPGQATPARPTGSHLNITELACMLCQIPALVCT
jgi:hypothetical protein